MTRALTPANLPEALILLGEDPSLVPMAGRAVGLEMPDLTLKILAQTLEADDV